MPFCLHVSLRRFQKYRIMNDINPLYCAPLPGYTWQCRLKYSDIKLQTLQDKDMIL